MKNNLHLGYDHIEMIIRNTHLPDEVNAQKLWETPNPPRSGIKKVELVRMASLQTRVMFESKMQEQDKRIQELQYLIEKYEQEDDVDDDDSVQSTESDLPAVKWQKLGQGNDTYQDYKCINYLKSGIAVNSQDRVFVRIRYDLNSVAVFATPGKSPDITARISDLEDYLETPAQTMVQENWVDYALEFASRVAKALGKPIYNEEDLESLLGVSGLD